MKYKFIVLALSTAILVSFGGCSKDETNTNQTPTDPFLVKTMTLYTGTSMDKLELDEKTEFQYNGQNQIISRKLTAYQNSYIVKAKTSTFSYSQNMIKEKYYAESIGNNGILLDIYYYVNSQNHVVKDSTIDLVKGYGSVTRYTYNSNNQRIYSYIGDTTSGSSILEWTGDNITKEYRKYGTMPRMLYASYTYGNVKNTNKTGDFWYDGERSFNLPEKTVDPNYEYAYTYKIESDGFVSECLTTITTTGGSPYRYEKIVYTR